MKKILYSIIIVTILSCKTEDKEKTFDNFKRSEMLTFWADKLIIPAYQDFSEKTKKMNDAVSIFVEKPNSNNLNNAKNMWEKAYISWQKASLYQIGKAQEYNMVGNMNTYPTNTKAIKEYAKKGNYNLDSPNLYDKQGFPALDYLLNGLGTNQETVAFYSKEENKGLKKYLTDISNRINTLATGVLKDWKGAYRKSFIENDGYTTTSSVDKLVNFYVIPFYEKQFREYKLTIPAGVRTDKALPAHVEAYYAKNLSKKLYITTLKTIKNFFRGVGYNGEKGKSLQQYLEALNRKDLANEINKRLNKLSELSNSLDDSFINQIKKDKNKMFNTFDAIQAVLKKFKPDMMSAMSVTNTSTDTDND